MKAVKRELLLGGPGHLQELHLQAGDARKILIEGDHGQIAFEGGPAPWGGRIARRMSA
jgi:hypothetical protein